MHIVWIHRGMYPEFAGGTYTYIYELGRRLTARGHRIDVISRTLAPKAMPPETIGGMRAHRYIYRRVNPVYSTYQHLNNVYDIYSEIAAEEPVDILGVHDTHLGLKTVRSPEGRAACQIPTYHAPSFLEYRFDAAWRMANEPSVLRRGLHKLTGPVLEKSQWRFESGVLDAAQGVVVLSEFSRNNIAKHFPHIDVGKVKIIPSGVDTDRFAPAESRAAARAELGFGDDTVHLLTVRRLAPRMGIENLLEALAMLKERTDADVRLTVCGGGSLRSQLEERAARLGVAGDVTFAGHVEDEVLVRHYQAADLFVLPTAALEGFGISTVEALSTNLPVVGTPAGATPEILGRIDERMVTRDTSAAAIADAVHGWLTWRHEHPDTTRYREFVLANYTWDAVTQQVETYYETMSTAFRRGELP
jgi:glycosyltransferase involved in cell wall biosynthesis